MHLKLHERYIYKAHRDRLYSVHFYIENIVDFAWLLPIYPQFTHVHVMCFYNNAIWSPVGTPHHINNIIFFFCICVQQRFPLLYRHRTFQLIEFVRFECI